MIIAGVFWTLTAAVVLLFVGRAWSPVHVRSAGRASAVAGVRDRVFRARDRGQLVRTGVDAIAMLAIVRALFPPPGWGSWLWVVALVATGVGVAGVILGWQLWAPSSRRWTTIAYVVVGAGLVAVLA